MTTFDPGWLDRQYNNRLRIPEHPQIFARWESASALARQKSICQLDLPYGNGAGEALDVFIPNREHAPILVFIHGGYWRALDKRDVSFIAPSFIQDGAMVVVPNYALCPAVSVDAITLQMVKAVEWAFRNAATYGADCERIVVAGHSAGGHLATMMLSCEWDRVAADLPRGLVSSALSISGLFDLEPIRHTPFLKEDLGLTEASAVRLSPARLPAPTGVLHALVGAQESEEFLRQNQLIRDVWGAKTVPVCESIAGTNHLDVLHDFADAKGRSHALALELLGVALPGASLALA